MFIRAILTSLSVNYIISTISGSVSIDFIFFSFINHIFRLLCVPGDFLFDGGLYEIYIVGCSYCICFFKSMELCSISQLSYMASVESF